MNPFTGAFFRPAMPAFTREERLRASTGVALGLTVVALISWLLSPLYPDWVLLFPPLGATAVLVFAVPNGPLSQPLSCVGGSCAAAFVTIALAMVVPAPYIMPVAVFTSIMVMMALRILHPPGGAMAVMLSLSIQNGQSYGFDFVLFPVGLTCLVLVLCGAGWNHLTGRKYPFRQTAPSSTSSTDPTSSGLSSEELQTLLTELHQNTNIGAVDLGRLLAAAEEERWKHRFANRTCGSVMTRDIISLSPAQPLSDIVALFTAARVNYLPVLGLKRELMGVVGQGAVMATLAAFLKPTGIGLSRFWKRTAAQPTAADMMEPDYATVRDTQPVGQLVEALSKVDTHVFAVVDAKGLFVGLITRSDILTLLMDEVLPN